MRALTSPGFAGSTGGLSQVNLCKHFVLSLRERLMGPRQVNQGVSSLSLQAPVPMEHHPADPLCESRRGGEASLRKELGAPCGKMYMVVYSPYPALSLFSFVAVLSSTATSIPSSGRAIVASVGAGPQSLTLGLLNSWPCFSPSLRLWLWAL